MFGPRRTSSDPLFTADGPTLRPRFHADDEPTPDDPGTDHSADHDPDAVGDSDHRSDRRTLKVKLGVLGLVVAIILAALGFAADLMQPDTEPDRPDLRVMAWWWDAFDTYPDPIGSGSWRDSVCRDDRGHVQNVIARETKRQNAGWPSDKWVVSIAFEDLEYAQSGSTASVRLSSTTDFYPRGDNGFDFWSGLDQDWQFQLQRDGDRWCVHRIVVAYRPGFDPADGTLTYGDGGLIGNAPGDAGADDTIEGGLRGEAHR
ncbi:hypothetical protein [Cryptosporangium phraense]|uniref:Uncharacterized protein n=1 Tax=Cryptosporangium phraense TaxID=2593070 RepID=A0A545AED7_9ACTN|nr:hypothetical protein [Cryptosporangium phraense]TQS39707.1 hypothetical protein FL583_38715 [Cryptosporangium phraense]